MNADGTGAGKTVQELALAYHYVSTTGKSVVIFTESDQIMQQAFFGDARRLLGLPTPDAIEGGSDDDECKNLTPPRNYKGLYGLYDAPNLKTKLNELGLKKIPVVAFNPKDWKVQDGTITVAFYHHLSLWGQGHEAERALEQVRREEKEVAQKYKRLREQIKMSVDKT